MNGNAILFDIIACVTQIIEIVHLFNRAVMKTYFVFRFHVDHDNLER